jgi:hypothetical protein
MRTDTERLDWLEHKVNNGACPGLINDDNGHWALAFDGMQSVSWGDKPVDVETTFFIKAEFWHNTIREAIDYHMDKPKGGAR